MNILKQIRWQQRFIHLEKSFQSLYSAATRKDLNIIEQAGLIQFFEITFELSWKTIKDYLEAEGIIATSPRDVIKQAFAMNILTDGKEWLDALEKRNLMTHTYQEETANLAVTLIKTKYTELIQQLIKFLKNKIFPAEKYGFALADYIILLNSFLTYTEIESVKIFGSRAMGNFKPYSDVDLCLYGNINTEFIAKIHAELSELTKLPYQFDIVGYNLITEKAFKAHIDNNGQIIYENT